jgi:ornithine cyclodeaminase
MLLLSKEDIKQIFTIKDAIAADKEAFAAFSDGQLDVPLRTNVQAPAAEGVFLFMPAYSQTAGYAMLKDINIFPHNRELSLPTAPAQVLLIDGQTGIVSAVIDGTYLTQLRTGAASGAAFDVLGRKDSKIGAVIGAGGQSATQLAAMLAVRDLGEARVFDLDFERAEAMTAAVKADYPDSRTEVRVVRTSDEAVADADLIITVTPSLKPGFDASMIKAGATISGVGCYQPHMQEIDPLIFRRASKLYFDSKDAVLSEAGDILKPLEAGLITEAAFTGDLGDVLLGKTAGRASEEEIIVFKTVGSGAQDLITAKNIFLKARDAGVGTVWNP